MADGPGPPGQWGAEPFSATPDRRALVRYYQAAGFAPTDRFTVDDWQGQVLEQRLQRPSAPSP